VLYALGRFDEAAEKTDLAEHLAASDDVASQTIWRQLRAKLLAREGNTDTAVALAEEAASMTEGTDCWDTLNMAFEDLGEVYALVGRRDDAIRALEKALDVCERKGAIVVADSLRAKVASLEAGS
jgi:tetratricopeptide (TPR) repeat protein